MAHPDYKFTGNTEDFECPICTLVVSSPIQTNCCGSVYCKSCILQWSGTSSGSGGSQRQHRRRSVKCCPNCRHTPLQYYDDKRTERMVKGLTVMCSNHKSACDWTGELRNLSDHLNSSSTSGCKYQVVSCPNRCGDTSILRSHLQDHIKEKCPHRKVQCIYCQLTGHHKVIIGSHYDECPRVPVQCPNSCSTSDLVRLELMEHIEKCPLQVVPCEYSHAGCDKRMARKDTEIHRVTGMVEHLTLVNKKLLQLQEQIACKDHIAPIVFKMSNFSQQQSWDSPYFYSHNNGYKLQLVVTVNRTKSTLFGFSSITTPASHSTAISVGSTVAPFCASSTIRSGLFNTNTIANSTSSSNGLNLMVTNATNIITATCGVGLTSPFAASVAATSSTSLRMFTPNTTAVTSNTTVSRNTKIWLTKTSAGVTNTGTRTTDSSASIGATCTTGNARTTNLVGTSATASTSRATPSSSIGATSVSSFTTSTGPLGCSNFNASIATGSLSISVIVKEGPFDVHLQWPMCARVNVKLLNQLQDSQHHSVTFQIETGTTHVPVESDRQHFIFCNMLNAALSGLPVQFLKDDTLYFQVTMELLGAHQPQPWLNCNLVLP